MLCISNHQLSLFYINSLNLFKDLFRIVTEKNDVSYQYITSEKNAGTQSCVKFAICFHIFYFIKCSNFFTGRLNFKQILKL